MKTMFIIINPDFFEPFDLIEVQITPEAEQDFLYYIEEMSPEKIKEMRYDKLFDMYCDVPTRNQVEQ